MVFLHDALVDSSFGLVELSKAVELDAPLQYGCSFLVDCSMAYSFVDWNWTESYIDLVAALSVQPNEGWEKEVNRFDRLMKLID